MSCALGKRPPSCSCGLCHEPGPAWPWGHCQDLLLPVWRRCGCLGPRYPLEAEFKPLQRQAHPVRVRGTGSLGRVRWAGDNGPWRQATVPVQFWADTTCGPGWVLGLGAAWPFKRASRGGGQLPSNRRACVYLSLGDQKCPAGHRVAGTCPADRCPDH